MPGIGIITNPYSKLNKGNSHREKLLSYIVGEQGSQKTTHNIKDLEKSLQHFHKQDIDILAINGGDGTISCTLTTLIQTYKDKPLPKILILPGGTINTLAQNLSIRGTPEKILFQALKKHSSPSSLRCRSLPSIEVKNHHGFMFASGTCAHFLETFYKNKTNALGSLWLVVKIFFSKLTSGSLYNRVVRSQLYELHIEKRSLIKHHSCSILCSSLRNLPLGIPYFRNINKTPQAFELSSVTTSPNKLPWKLPSLIFKKKSDDKVNITCKNITIKSESEINYTLDGELFSTTDPLEVKVGKFIDFIIL